MFTLAFLELEIRFISIWNHRKKMFASDVANVLKEFIYSFIFDENLLKACDSTDNMDRETHFRSFEPYLLLLQLLIFQTYFEASTWFPQNQMSGLVNSLKLCLSGQTVTVSNVFNFMSIQ